MNEIIYSLGELVIVCAALLLLVKVWNSAEDWLENRKRAARSRRAAGSPSPSDPSARPSG